MAPRPSQRHSVGGTLIGVFIGIIVGLGLASSVAYWLMKNNPAISLPSFGRDMREPNVDSTKGARADSDKPRFDFYKILPGAEEAKGQPERRAAERGDRSVADQSKDRLRDKATERGAAAAEKSQPAPGKVAAVDPQARPVKAAERFWLQAGSFSTEPDAENLRARLALSGWEAIVQEGALPDKSVRYRVRLGPFDNSDELGRMKTELSKRGFDVAVIKY